MLLVGVVTGAPASAAAQGSSPRRLEIELRVRVDEGPREPIADLRDLAVGADGRVYVLDGRLQVVHIYRTNGTFEKSVSRVGSGPGELRRANGLVVAPDQTVWVNDPGNNRITVFAPDGTYLRQFHHDPRGFGYVWDGAFDRERRLITSVHVASGDRGSRAWQRMGLDGRILDTVPAPESPTAPNRSAAYYQVQFENRRMMAAYPFREPVTPAFDPRGFWWSVSPGEYRIRRIGLDGAEVVTAGRTGLAPEPIPKEVRDDAIRRIQQSLTGAKSHDVDFSLVPATYAFVRQLAVDDRLRLWARRASADSLNTTFDVFTGDGGFLFSTTLAARLSPYSRILIASDRLYAVALDDDDLPTIVRARLLPAR